MGRHDICYVIGSGPAGIACAQGLLSAGKNVTILDSGVELERERRTSLDRLSVLPKSEWSPNDLRTIKGGVTASESGIPLKLAYGSDYPYREVPGATSILTQGADTMPSYALGGLSTVWGSSVLPYRQQDIENWPISISDLEPGYREVLRWMPLSAANDDLEQLFPLYREQPESACLPISRQAEGVLEKLKQNRVSLNGKGVFFGRSRLAVRSEDETGRQACVRCGLCMYGCPKSLIYSSDQTLHRLLSASGLKYESGVTVQRVKEDGEGVTIEAINQAGESVKFQGSKVFLGAGLLNTTAILLRSLEQYDSEVFIQDSQYFLMPILRMKGTSDVISEPLHTLAQLFVEVFDESISPYTVHLQTYTYNDLYRQAIESKIRALKHIFPMNEFLGRLMLFQGYLHSSHSEPISVQLVKAGQKDTLKLSSGSTPSASCKRKIRQLGAKLLRLSKQTGLAPLSPLLQMGKPGRGFHSGGTFPMSAKPKPLETDVWGRPPAFKRIHAIDATILPTIPATTVTLTVMANANRIGTAAGGVQ